jgi:hypothetical protein
MPFANEHPLYRTWVNMRSRCRNPAHPGWSHYGGRGISVCSQWDSFHQFLSDMGPRPQGFSIDRIDNDGNYTPQNCRWATRSDQALNQRKTVILTIGGVAYKASVLARQAGKKVDTIIARARAGLPLDEVVSSDNRPMPQWGKAKATLARRALPRQTHCKRGHEFTLDNTSFNAKGGQVCRACQRERVRAYRQRAKAAQT